MNIGIDARFYGSVGKGLGRYTQKLVENLEKASVQGGLASGRDDRYFIFLRKENWEECQPKSKNFTKVLSDIPWYGFREQIILPWIFKKYSLDLVHFPHFNVPIFYKGKFVVTIHDLILFHYPTKRASTLSPFFYFFKKMAHRLVIRNAIKKSQYIIAVSNHTKKDIEKRFDVPENKIVVTHEGIDPIQRAPSEPSGKILEKYGIIKPYLLYVGNVYPHKNLERLVLVFREVAKKHPHLHLVLVGKEDYFYKRLKKYVSESFAKNVIFADFVPDEHLEIVYREALLYVFPSLYEGFGLPPLEAMAKNIPVASSNASCLREVLGNAAIYFDPRGMAEMAETIEKAIADADLRNNLIAKGREQVKKYSWEKMAKETLEIYKKVS
jgi:glycosyltransferase involved in cell wall biosynthesis